MRGTVVWAALVLISCKGDKAADDTPAAAPAAAEPAPSTSDAQAAKPPAIEPKVERRPADYARDLARGRKLIKAGKAAEAATAFRAAESARPGDPMALSELSWAAFKAGDLAAAKHAATRSIDSPKADPSIRAMSLYNRGRVLEQEGDARAAVADYQKSYELRPHKVVRKKLEQLGADVPESVWRAAPLAGPFDDFNALCKSLGHPREREEEPPFDWWCGDSQRAIPGDMGALEWADNAVTFEHYRDDYEDYPVVSIALPFFDPGKATVRFYLLEQFAMRGNRHQWEIASATILHDRLVIESTAHEGRFAYDDERFVTICGVGASGAPSCLGPISIFYSMTDYEGGKEDGHELPPEVAYQCTAKLTGPNRLVITAKDAGCRGRSGFAGEHTLLFP